mmetsp:Transcript_17527/g.32315  ORF Transcript_17527/g.32315 Transcript_17527/m.32315 type:complete len:94 (+) Transcript_17527:132-413(+)
MHLSSTFQSQNTLSLIGLSATSAVHLCLVCQRLAVLLLSNQEEIAREASSPPRLALFDKTQRSSPGKPSANTKSQQGIYLDATSQSLKSLDAP